MEITLVPYVKYGGEWSVSDDNIMRLWDKLVEDKTHTTVFYDGGVTSREYFLKLMQSNDNNPLVVLIDQKIAGFAWFNSVSDNFAFGHFAFFRSAWGVTDEVGQRIIKYWFSLTKSTGEPIFKTILGAVPEFNERAIKFVQRIGFVKLGTIPEFSYFPYFGEDKGVTLFYRKD